MVKKEAKKEDSTTEVDPVTTVEKVAKRVDIMEVAAFSHAKLFANRGLFRTLEVTIFKY